MINLNMLPCVNCIYFNGIKQKGTGEKNQFISCKASKSGNAESILETNGKTIRCKWQEEEDKE